MFKHFKYLFLACFILFSGALNKNAHAELSFEQFYQKHSSIILLIVPSDGSIVGANKSAENFYGYSLAELKKLRIQDINALSSEEVAAERLRAQEANRNFFIFRHRLKDGSIRTVEVNSNPYQYKGQKILVSVIHDISKRRQVESDLWHYQTQLEQMVDRQTKKLTDTHNQTLTFLFIGIAVLFLLIIALLYTIKRHNKTHKDLILAKKIVDQEHKQLDEIIWSTNVGTWEWNVVNDKVEINNRFAEMLGYTKEELTPATLNSWLDNTHPTDITYAQDQIQKTLTRENDHYEAEFRMIHKNGSFIWVYSKGNVVEWDENGKPLRMSGTHTDISRRKRMEAELQEAKKIAEKASQAKTEFLTTIGRELKTPMQGIWKVIDHLRENKHVIASDTKLLDELEISSDTLISLLNDITDLSQIEAGQLHLEADTWEPSKIVERIVSLYRPHAMKKDLILRSNAAQFYDFWCKTDDIRLRQIISNLVSNAIKYTENGYINITMDVNLGENSDRLIIHVSDSGNGMTDKQLEQILQHKNASVSSLTEKYDQTGWGLAVSQELAGLMGGEITAKSELNKGTTFSLSLPVSWHKTPPIDR